MISPEEFALLNQNAHKFYASQGGFNPKKSKNVGGKRGSSPTAFISEAGGAGGALGGAALGTAILPGVGTLLGAGIGGFVGGFGGKLAENKIRDNEFRPGEALTEGAISGVMGAGPLRSAGAVGAGVKAAVKGGAAGTLEDALSAAGERYAGKGITSETGAQLANASDKFRVKSFRLSPSQITNYGEKHKEDVVETMKRYGVKRPEDIDTKGIAPLQAGFDEAISMLPDVSKKSVLDSFKAKYEPLLKSASHDYIQAGQALKQQAKTINKKFGDTIPAQELNGLKKDFDNVVGYTDKRMNPATYNTNKYSADALRDVLHSEADRLGIRNAQGMTLKQVGTELSKLYQMRKVAQKQLGLGRGAQTIRLTDAIGAGAGAAAGGPVGAAAMAAGTHAINSPAGTRALSTVAGGLGKAYSGLGGVLDHIGASPAGAGIRAGAAGALTGGMGGGASEQPQTLEDAMMGAQDTGSYDPTAGNVDVNGNPTNAGVYTPEQQAQANAESSPYSKENLVADIQRDPKHAKDYISYYKELADIYAPPEPATKGRNSAASGVIADTKTGLNALQELGNSISSNNANFPIVGGLRGLNKFDTSAQKLQADIATTKQIVGKALEGGVLRKEDEAKYAKILPTMNDTDATAQYKMQYLYQLISQRLAEYESQLGGSGGGDLSDYITQIQQAQQDPAYY